MFIVRRALENPILVPRRENPWEAFGAYNPSVVRDHEGLRLYYRALADPSAPVSPYAGQSTVGMARSQDGVRFHSRQQVLAPAEPWDAFSCEDPRASYFEGMWYVFYTALGGYPFGPENIKVGVAVSTDGEHFNERHLVTPFNAKAATLFPERINGDIVLLLTAHTDYTPDHPRPTIALARAKNIEDFWDPAFWEKWHADLPAHAVADLRRSDADHIEVGASPVKTERGWLLFYSYIQNYYDEHKRVFGVEAALLDAENPQKALSRTYPFLVPEEIYELYGTVPNIVFPTSTLVEGGTVHLYYGAADTTCARASIKLADLLDALAPVGSEGSFLRAPENPILSPQGDGFEKLATFNAAAVDLAGSVHILYRAMGKDHTSTFGYARSADGIHIDERLAEPAYVPRAEFEMKRGGDSNGNSGCEDPRLVAIGDRVHLTYTAYDGAHNPRGASSSISIEDFLAKRFDQWTLPALATPDDVDDKDIGLLPEKVGDHYVLYHRIAHRVCADLLPDLTFGKRATRCIEILAPRPGMWDSAKVGIAGPPIPVGVDWLLIYHGISDHGVYRLGAALLSTDGCSVLARTADPILEPIEPYEKEGEVNKVVFSCGAVVRPGASGKDTLFLYYGGGDKVLGVATIPLERIVKALS